MFDRGILRRMTLQFHEGDIHLQGCIRQQTDQVRLCRNLQGHQVEDDNLQRTNILRMRPAVIHNEDILVFEDINRRQSVRYS